MEGSLASEGTGDGETKVSHMGTRAYVTDPQ